MERFTTMEDLKADSEYPFEGIDWEEFHKCVSESVRESRMNQAIAWESAKHIYIS